MEDEYTPAPPLTSVNSTEQQAARLLTALLAHIRAATAESDEAVSDLTDSFTTIVEHATALGEEAAALAEGAAKQAITAHSQDIMGKMQAAVVAFQFYDKLSQRLDQAWHALEATGALLADPARNQDPAGWQKLCETVRGHFTVEADRQLFQAILDGRSVEEALAGGHAPAAAQDVELF